MSRTKVLIVDDEPLMLTSLKRVLSPHYEVQILGSASEVAGLTRDWEPDIVLLDIHMPGKDGFAVASELRQRSPGTDLILMTGQTENSSSVLRALGDVAFYYLEKPFDLDALLTLLKRCDHYRRLSQEYQLAQRYREETEEAQRLQRGLLPGNHLTVQGIRITCLYEPYFHLGGDFYDFAVAPNGDVSFIIADVSGHGFAAAMLTGVIKATFHAVAAPGHPPLDVARSIASSVSVCSNQLFATLLCGRIARDRRVLEFVNAGHPEGFLWGAVWPPERLKPTGPFLGAMAPDVPLERGVVELEQNDKILLLTDGVYDPREEDGRFFDEAQVEQAIARAPEGGEALVCRLRDSLNAYWRGASAKDDVALMAIQVER